MKTIFAVIFVSVFIPHEIISQVVTGKLIDENSLGLAEVQLQLYTPTNVYEATSSSDGTFSFNIITGVEEDNQLPTGYSVSNNFPNPFNPRTRINISLPHRENVKVEVFNLLGQSVADLIEETFDAGTNYIDIELNGLPNGFYISRISIGDKYTVVKKLMLIYGSQHLITSGSTINTQLNKPNNTYLETNLDSLVATSTIIGRKTFIDLPSFISDTLDLGNLTIERFCPGIPTVTDTRDAKVYNTILIGEQCWLRENMNIGTRIDGSQEQTNNSAIEKYCYNDSIINCETYGALYQWDEAMQYVTNEGAQGICPSGWHIPSLAEFQTLAGLVNNDGNALKREDQGTDDGQGTNSSGFSALLAGYHHFSGTFYSLGQNTFFWSSMESESVLAYNLNLYDYVIDITLNNDYKVNGLSVRCLKGEPIGIAPSTPNLSLPLNEATNIEILPTLSWNESTGATSYALQVSADSNFTSFVYYQSELTDTSQQVTGLNYLTTYYWRVSAANSYGTSDWSDVWNFTTAGITYCPGLPTVTDARDGKVYNTVLIGDQCWLRENMNIGTRIDGILNQTDNDTLEKFCYNNLEANCETYGGIYQWNEAMQYATGEGALGICPDGWRIPTYAEFQTLKATVNNDGNALKAVGQDTTSTNTSGFSGLLAGRSFENGSFNYLSINTSIWSSTGYGADYVYYLYLYHDGSNINLGFSTKGYGSSVRCLKGEPIGIAPATPNLSLPLNEATNVEVLPTLSWNESTGATSYALQVSADSNFTSFVYDQIGLTDTSQQVTGLNYLTTYYWRVNAANSYGTSDWSGVWNFTTVGISYCPGLPTVTDARDGKVYNTVLIGDQCWLRENMNIGTMGYPTNNGIIEKYCYNNVEDSCNIYGGLYYWNEAMQYATTEGAQGICPDGWHIPTEAEYQTLITFVNNDGNALKREDQGSGSGQGTNNSEFSGLLAGGKGYSGGPYQALGVWGSFWMSKGNTSAYAYTMQLLSDTSTINTFSGTMVSWGMSVRCIKD